MVSIGSGLMDPPRLLIVDEPSLAIAHHGYALSQGRLVAEGAARALADNEAVRAAYFG